jgi:very-short-patch-repair endonuclease
MRKETTRARDLRRTATETERIAWRLLRGLRLRGFKFRRQHPVGSWIADFCCPEKGLVVELDGSVHAQPSQARKDASRDRALARMGYTILRLPNGIVLQDSDAFVSKVMERAQTLPNFFTGETSPPHPRPLSPQGGEGRRSCPSPPWESV